MEEAACWLAPHDWLSLLPHRAYSYTPKGSTIHGGPGPSCHSLTKKIPY